MGKLWVRHLVVAGVVVFFTIAGWNGWIGKVNFSRIDQWQVTARPNAEGGLDVTEIIDLDLGTDPGYELQLRRPGGYNRPMNLEVSSPDAPDEVTMTDIGDDEVRIQIGDPKVDVVGQHRYVITYTLDRVPALHGDVLVLAAITRAPLDVTKFHVNLTGFELRDRTCEWGRRRSTEECILDERSGGGYEVALSDVSAGTNVTVRGKIADTFEQAAPTPLGPPPPGVRQDQARVGLATGGACLFGAALSFLWCRGRGRNRVFVGAEPDAGSPPIRSESDAPAPSRAVSDAGLLAMATTEFVPPPDIAPWEGQVLITERFVRDDVFNAYLAGLAGQGAIEIAPTKKGIAITPGPNVDATALEDRRYLDAIFDIGVPFKTGKYNKEFKAIYQLVIADLYQRLVHNEWWRRGTPRPRAQGGVRFVFGAWLAMAAFILLIFPLGILVYYMHSSVPLSVAVSFVVGVIIGRLAYKSLLPARTAAGSALLVRTESFRRFLDEATGPQIEQAWEHGLLLEYSGWAVALGEARTWKRAVRSVDSATTAAVIDAASGPLFIDENRNSIARSAGQWSSKNQYRPRSTLSESTRRSSRDSSSIGSSDR